MLVSRRHTRIEIEQKTVRIIGQIDAPAPSAVPAAPAILLPETLLCLPEADTHSPTALPIPPKDLEETL